MVDFGLIVVGAIVIFGLAVIFKGFKIVQQSECVIVERLVGEEAAQLCSHPPGCGRGKGRSGDERAERLHPFGGLGPHDG